MTRYAKTEHLGPMSLSEIERLADDVAAMDAEFSQGSGTSPASRMVRAVRQLLAEVRKSRAGEAERVARRRAFEGLAAKALKPREELAVGPVTSFYTHMTITEEG